MAKQTGGPSISRPFTTATPSYVARAQGDPSAMRQLRAIDDRGNGVKEKLKKHFSKYEETWVVKEAVSLWKQRAGLYEPAVGLPRIAKEYAAQAVMTEARRNVRARMTKRLTNVNGIKTRMGNAVVRNLQSLEPGRNRAIGPDGPGPRKGSPSQ